MARGIILILAFKFYLLSLFFQSSEGINYDYWNTSGNHIIDSTGDPVYFSGVNWNGFEAANCIVDGLWGGLDRSYASHLQQMAYVGFNMIRLPFAGTCVQPDVYPKSTAIDSSTNSDLQGLTTVEAMRKIIQEAANRGLRVILDYHRRDKAPLDGTPEDGLWFSDDFPASYWLETWKLVATAFKDEPNVVGVDLWNEPRGGVVWTNDSSNPVDFFTAAKAAADLIQSIQPSWLIFVEGIYQGNTWWGADLTGVKKLSLNLSVPQKLVYSVHDYGPIVFNQPWFVDPDFPANLPPMWDNIWGFVHKKNISPIWIGEFGSKLVLNSNADKYTKEIQWLDSLVGYVRNKSLSWTWFTWGPNSGDTGGMLEDDWHTVNINKLAKIQPILYPSNRVQNSSYIGAPPPPSPPKQKNGTPSSKFPFSRGSHWHSSIMLILGSLPFVSLYWLLIG